MQPLTLNCPKPLLEAGGKPLLEHWLVRLEAAGVREIIVNVAYLGAQIEQYVTQRHGLATITVSRESEPLETGGALYKALPLLGEAPFLLVNADVFCDVNVASLIAQASMAEGGALFVLVPNPAHNPQGDFVLSNDGQVWAKDECAAVTSDSRSCTFSGVSVMSPALIAKYPHCREKFALREVFQWALAQRLIRGRLHDGYWLDVGTPERLQALNTFLTES